MQVFGLQPWSSRTAVKICFVKQNIWKGYSRIETYQKLLYTLSATRKYTNRILCGFGGRGRKFRHKENNHMMQYTIMNPDVS